MILKYIFIAPIKLYQWFISPILQSMFGMKCRYEPSCSYYTIEAIKEWGVLKGIIMGGKRILSCSPWGGSGYDPVPRNPSKS